MTGCGTDEEGSQSNDKENVVHAETDEKDIENDKSTEEVGEKEWEDVTQLEEGVDYGGTATTAKGYISSIDRSFSDEPDQDSKLIQAGYSKYYYYYLEAMGMQTGLSVVQVQGELIEKDFDNLRSLAAIIVEEQKKRGEDLNPEAYGENKREAVKDWAGPSERMKQAVEYTKQLTNDLDVAINDDGEARTFGVAYQADGKKTNEIDSFIDSGE